MTTQIEAMKLALARLQARTDTADLDTIAALNEALAEQPAQQLIEDLLSALEYHTEQTRPIQFSNVAMEAAREYLRKPEQPTQQDIPDLIAGALGVSRGTAYDMMREALAEASPPDPCCWPGTSCDAQQEPVATLFGTLPVYDKPAPDYAWPTVQDYEADVGFKVNDAFQMGWDMARTTNDLFRQMGAAHDNTD